MNLLNWYLSAPVRYRHCSLQLRMGEGSSMILLDMIDPCIRALEFGGTFGALPKVNRMMVVKLMLSPHFTTAESGVSLALLGSKG